MAPEWRVPLPRDVPSTFDVYLNGVPQKPGVDYSVRNRELVFTRPIAREGKLGKTRWASMFLGVAGTYKQNDSVDVSYQLDGRTVVATALPIIQPG